MSLLGDVLTAAGISLDRDAAGTASLSTTSDGCGAAFCGWCGRYLHLVPGLKRGQTSHGICAPLCQAARDAGYDDYHPTAEQIRQEVAA